MAANGMSASSNGAAVNKGFKVLVEGEYYCATDTPGRKQAVRYSLHVILPDIKCALSVIKNKLLNKLLTKKYPDYIAYRTHRIVHVENLNNPGAVIPGITLREMDRGQIKDYIAQKELPVKLEAFPELDALREAVQLAETNPDEFEILQAAAAKDVKLNESLANLNEGLDDKSEKPLTKEEMADGFKPLPAPEEGEASAEENSGASDL